MSLGRGLASCWLPATVTLEVRNFFQSMVYGHTGYTLDDLHSEYNLTYINMYLFQPNSDTFVDRLYWWEDLLPTIIIPTCPSISNIHNLQETLLQYAMPLSPFYYQYYTFPPGTVYYVSCVCLSLILCLYHTQFQRILSNYQVYTSLCTSCLVCPHTLLYPPISSYTLLYPPIPS